MVSNSLINIFDHFDRNMLTPYAVGFDRVFDQLQSYATNNITSTGFPPYNIRKDGDHDFVIEIALAGLSKDDIEVEVADSVLTIRSAGRDEDSNKEKDNVLEGTLLHRGISYRQFTRKWTLADDIVVNEAKMENGMLLIKLERVIPDEKKPRLIKIK
jgi:molecular chaperone IbpA